MIHLIPGPRYKYMEKSLINVRPNLIITRATFMQIRNIDGVVQGNKYIDK